MKPIIGSLRQGQTVWAVVEECIAQNEIVVNFSGDLVRVQNMSEQSFRVGARIKLLVERINPLSFKLVTRPQISNARSFEVTV